MDIATIVGFVAGIVFILLSMLIGTSFDMPKIGRSFLDLPAVMITIGGTLSATVMSAPLPRFIAAMKAVGKTVSPPRLDPAYGIRQIIDLANLARKESLLALEDVARDMDDKFVRKGLMLIVDGTDPELVRNIMETEMSYIEMRHAETRGVWEFVANAAPAWGMIGTLIGLILMLQDMGDVAAIGPSMAVALITTFYGSLLSNFIANPIVSKLKIYSGDEMLLKEVMIEGILSIQSGENPRIIEEKLKAFLSPQLRLAEGEPTEEQY